MGERKRDMRQEHTQDPKTLETRRVTSRIRKRLLLGPYSRNVPRVLEGS